jgi:peroxiredoxin
MGKNLALILFFICVLGGIGVIFWEQEFKYTLPTPVPENYTVVSPGDSVDLPFLSSSPTFTHFYNNDCPCSRFNIEEFEAMVRKYSKQVNFQVILQTNHDPDALQEFKSKYDLDIDIIEDPDGELAAQLGVYSTPQAVIIKDQKIFYRGNYNRARFCVSKNTKFAELALEALINNKACPVFPEVALISYGCELPSHAESNSSNLFTFF